MIPSSLKLRQSCQRLALAGAIIAASAATAEAQNLTISFTNAGTSSMFFTPVWFGIHNGSFDLFNPGAASSLSLEMLAEDGIVGGLQSDFTAIGLAGGVQGVLANPAGFPGAPVIDPGETATSMVNVSNGALYRYFSYASMVIPSNDSFIANGNPTAIELFDALGNFNGPLTIQVFSNQIWDAGTEVNNTFGAAFSAVGGTSSDQNGVIALLPDGGLNNFIGTQTAAGTTITSTPSGGQLIGTIQIVPEPSAMLLAGLGVIQVLGRRRRTPRAV